MKKFIFILAAVFVLITSGCSNRFRAEKMINDIFTCVAWVEGDDGENVYWCGARWTGPYGVTVDEQGLLFHRGDKVSKKRAKKLACKHLEKQVFPFLGHVERRLSDKEIIAVCLFIYNVGGEQFSGHKIDGSVARDKCGRVVPPSQFLQAINRGDRPEKVVNYMTGFRKSGGCRANGLLKRHWVTGAIYLGEISVNDVKKCRPKSFYDTKNFGNYYWLDGHRNIICEGGYYKLRYDKTTKKAFKAMNFAKSNQRSVNSIV